MRAVGEEFTSPYSGPHYLFVLELKTYASGGDVVAEGQAD
jgi:hypothetical protein